MEAKKVRKRQIKKTRPDLTSIRDDKALIYTRNTGIFSAIIPFRYVVRLFRSSSLFFFFITAKLLLLAIHGSFKCIGIYSALDVSGRPRRKKRRRFITAVPSPIYLPLFHKVYIVYRSQEPTCDIAEEKEGGSAGSGGDKRPSFLLDPRRSTALLILRYSRPGVFIDAGQDRGMWAYAHGDCVVAHPFQLYKIPVD